jgi:membrane-bound metal-dependent hydrolase YbcI (DUF457 family)
MMGRTHAASGWVAGLAAAPLLGQTSLTGALLVATATAGWALLPDLDHRHSSASRIFGPVTGAVSWLLRRTSRAVYAATKGPRDENCVGEHRHLSHTVAFAFVLGYLVTGVLMAAHAWSPTAGIVATIAVLLLGVVLAEDRLGDWVAVLAGGIAVVAAVGGDDTVLAEAPSWLGWSVAIGCVTHCLGDAITLSGCPFLWPIPIAGETFYELRPPRWLRFRTGGPVETWLMFPAFTVAGVLLIPGAWPVVVHLYATITS